MQGGSPNSPYDQDLPSGITTSKLVDERGSVYGPPEVNHERTARLWTAWLNAAGYMKPGHELDAFAVTALNRLQKESRLIETPAHADSLADIAGYAENDRMIAKARGWS